MATHPRRSRSQPTFGAFLAADVARRHQMINQHIWRRGRHPAHHVVEHGLTGHFGHVLDETLSEAMSVVLSTQPALAFGPRRSRRAEAIRRNRRWPGAADRPPMQWLRDRLDDAVALGIAQLRAAKREYSRRPGPINSAGVEQLTPERMRVDLWRRCLATALRVRAESRPEIAAFAALPPVRDEYPYRERRCDQFVALLRGIDEGFRDPICRHVWTPVAP